MEIGHEDVNETELETRDYYDSGPDFQLCQVIGFQIIDNGIQGLRDSIGIVSFVWSPLSHILRFPCFYATDSDIIERLQGTDRSRAYSY